MCGPYKELQELERTEKHVISAIFSSVALLKNLRALQAFDKCEIISYYSKGKHTYILRVRVALSWQRAGHTP